MGGASDMMAPLLGLGGGHGRVAPILDPPVTPVAAGCAAPADSMGAFPARSARGAGVAAAAAAAGVLPSC